MQNLQIKQEIQQKIVSHFGDLRFNEELHKYSVGNKHLRSVSKIIDNFVSKTNWTDVAYNIAPYKNTTGGELLKDWKYEKDISIVKGHKTHSFAEVLGVNSRKPQTNQERAIIQFWNDTPIDRYIRVDREIKMYHKQLFYSGTCDFLLYDTWTDKLILGDYKTNKDLFKNYMGKKLLFPFNFLLDQPLSKYVIQLSLYQILIEQIGIDVSERWVIWTLPDDKCKEYSLPLGSYKLYKVKDYTGTLIDWLHKQKAFYYYD